MCFSLSRFMLILDKRSHIKFLSSFIQAQLILANNPMWWNTLLHNFNYWWTLSNYINLIDIEEKFEPCKNIVLHKPLDSYIIFPRMNVWCIYKKRVWSLSFLFLVYLITMNAREVSMPSLLTISFKRSQEERTWITFLCSRDWSKFMFLISIIECKVILVIHVTFKVLSAF